MTKPIKLYHYATKHHPVLKTLEAQGVVTSSDRKKAIAYNIKYPRVGFYYQHISFLFNPINPKQMGDIYGTTHGVWYPGSKLIEHVVELEALKEFKYEIVETPEKVDLYYDDSLSLTEYHRRLDKVNLDNKYTGEGIDDFLTGRANVIDRVQSQLDNIKNTPDWDQIRSKYAAGVSHVMVYPKAMEIEVSKHSVVAIT